MTQSSADVPPVSHRMQELLSRAVQEQVTEQQQLTEALNGLRSLAEQLPGAVEAAANASAADLDARLAGLHEELRAVRGESGQNAAASGARWEELSRRLGELDTGEVRATPGDVESAVSPVLTAVADLGRRVEAMQERVESQLDERIGGLEERLAAHVDDAVLALAEALLRPVPAGGRTPRSLVRRSTPGEPHEPSPEPYDRPHGGVGQADEEILPAGGTEAPAGHVVAEPEVVGRDVEGHDPGPGDGDAAVDADSERGRSWWRPSE